MADENLLLSLLSHENSAAKILDSFNANCGVLIIEETDTLRWIRDPKGAIYSVMNKNKPFELVLPYMQTMMAGLLFQQHPANILILGAGGGAMLRYLVHYFPDSEIIPVDEDINIVRHAKQYFLDKKSKNNQFVIEKAENYLHQDSDKQFDLIFIDGIKRLECLKTSLKIL